MLEFAYNNGRGRVKLNLEMIIPCSAADMKRVLSFVNLSDDPDEHAKTIYDYIAVQVAELKKEREKHDENSAAGKEKITKIGIAVGNEGGISPSEIKLLNEKGFFSTIHFDVNILRCETAALYGIAAVQSAISQALL